MHFGVPGSYPDRLAPRGDRRNEIALLGKRDSEAVAGLNMIRLQAHDLPVLGDRTVVLCNVVAQVPMSFLVLVGGDSVEHVAGLAHLQLTELEHKQISTNLARIITMVDNMLAIDTEGVAPLAHPLDAEQRLRADLVTESVDRTLYQRGAPATEDGFYLVPRVIE